MAIFGPVNQAMFDWPWSGIHFFSGLSIGATLWSWPKTRVKIRFWLVGIGLLLAWELYERTMHYLDLHHESLIAGWKLLVGGFAFAPETWINTCGDMIIGTLGLLLGRMIVRTIVRAR